ncbi:hypothetical protein EKO27_g6503 [Xylaria grammica]|uniref:Late embryogenesis abundant protein LEA-2 subgroup domain-containing protein n=1 Tax=Xylaria grammica TaxID=363999 RepID=A0A439D2G9_9PEZI|nr:hypothetical protein EKO27_g6503 [Xylaria grammica]
MSKGEASPLLSAKKGKGADRDTDESIESTPLLSSSSATPGYDGDSAEPDRDDDVSIRSRHSHPPSIHSTKKKARRWPSCIAMGILGCFAIAIIILAFIVPDAVEEYAQQAAVIEPTSLSIDSITTDGVRARIQANFQLDGSRVKNDHVRRIGRASTWVANQLGSEKAEIDVYVPDYGNMLLGSAIIPPLVVSLRDGTTTKFDFIADIRPGNVDGMPNKIPAIPKYNITRFNVKDGPLNGSMLVDMSLSAFNEYPVQLDIPELAFEIMVPGCADTDPFIIVAEASTGDIHVEPLSDVSASVYGIIHELPDSLTRACPDSSSSPLDLFLKQYMHGEPATLFVRGSSRPDGDTPKWIADILASVTIPVPFPGRTLDGLIREFSLTDVHFTLPDPFADPNDPAANPQVSGNILVIASLPSEMNFAINVTNVRATADVIYKTKKMGELNLRKWQHANSTRVDGKGGDGPSLKIESRIIEAPLNITDSDVFADVVQALLFGNQPIHLNVQALVDVKVDTSLGELILKEVPAEGKVPVKPLPNGAISAINPKISSLRVVDSSLDSITLQALANITNPTPYTASVPFVNVHLVANETVLGDGFNTNITVKPHLNTIPGQPLLCKALSRFNATFAVPRLRLPGDSPGENSHFIRDASFHILSSTATFTLVSPLQFNTLYLDFVNATALYNHTEPIGRILYDLPFAAPPGKSQTPRLPVEWSIGSVGYDAVRRAVGGQLKLDTRAIVDARLGNWKESLWYHGKGIGASIHLT